MIDIFELIMEQLLRTHGLRFYCPLLIAFLVACIVHFTVGWTDVSVTIMIIITLIATIAATAWQHLYEQSRPAP
jgi:ABC-type transport system involved in cytochrome bd biosynthesis fused ATPase/permease subunit